MSSFVFDEEDIVRFLSYVDKLPNGCWFWTGARSRGSGNKKWYGSFGVKGKVVRAHRFSAEALGGKGPLPKGGHRDHTCVFSLCVNPAHIEYVSHIENQERKLTRKQNDQPGVDTPSVGGVAGRPPGYLYEYDEDIGREYGPLEPASESGE